MTMGVQADIRGHQERRVAPTQDEITSAKRFKASPSHQGPLTAQGDDPNCLKIRFSRFTSNTSPGRQSSSQGSSPAGRAGGTKMEVDSATETSAGSHDKESEHAEETRRVTRGNKGVNYQEPPDNVKAEDKDVKNLANVKLCEVRMSPLDTSVKSDLTIKEEKPQLEPNLHIGMSGTEIMSECQRVGPPPKGEEISTSILEIPTPMPKPRSALPKLSEDQLLPPTPCVLVKAREEAFSPQLMDWCLQRPIAVIRGLPQACGIDMSLYTTKTLMEMNPQHPVEIRTQLEQSSDENWDPSLREQVWYCTSSRSHTTIQKYAEYLSTSYKETKDRLGDQFTVNPKMEKSIDPDTGLPVRRTLKFGTNCDLSDEKKWKPQIQELMKLPMWLRVASSGNMLSHIGHQILGMNTLQLYMKVPCSRTPGHQENNNFAAVNINVGPGDSEWFGVPESYWGPLQELCEKNNVDYLHGSWWPKMEDMKEAGIPTYRFMQRPGEVVWVNTGCVHWVQASGWCNNVAWNTGPLTARQYNSAIERYEWNKTQKYQSIVAMVYLTWNMAKNIAVSDVELFKMMKRTLMRSIRQSVLMKQYALENDIPVRFHGHGHNEPVNYCMVCEEEVFNVMFVKAHEKKYVVHCLRCALNINKDLTGWICLEEYDIEDLIGVYDSFKLAPNTARTTFELAQEQLRSDARINNNTSPQQQMPLQESQKR